MKTLLSAFFILLANVTFAQTLDLIALAQGDYLGMNALFDEKGSLFGYISIYDYGRSGAKTKKFEYVVLDKNLNPFANKTFDGDITAGNYIGYVNFDGKIILSPNHLDASLLPQGQVFMPSSMIIDLKDNTIKKKVFYEFDHGSFKEMQQRPSFLDYQREHHAEKKQNGFIYVSNVIEIKEGGFLVLDYDNYGTFLKNNNIMRYDENKKELWRYEYNKTGSKTESQSLGFIEKDENYFYGILREKVKKSEKFYLIVIDIKTGKEVHKKEIDGPANMLSEILSFPTLSYGKLDNDKTFDDKIVLVGRSGITNNFNYVGKCYTGVSRLIIDRKTFEIELKTLSYKNDFKEYIPRINECGMVEKSYLLDPRDIFFMKDGSIGILFEKFKAAGSYNAQKTSDLVYVYTDKDFKIAGTKLFEKEKSKWENSDYLFSQNLNNGNDIVFFYKDFQKDEATKDKNWNLFINTLINGQFNQEIIPISSRENFVIFPYLAKEGYILLQEFNKTTKYNQIRLERLNY